MKDLWRSHPSANVQTYIIWTLTTLVASLYAIFVVKDLLFIIVVNLQLTACIVFWLGHSLAARVKKLYSCVVRQQTLVIRDRYMKWQYFHHTVIS